MSDKESLASLKPTPNKGRRMLLLAGTGAVGVVGAGFAAWPFIASWKPSARARAFGASVEAFIGDLAPGQLMRLEWRGTPIGILRRTEMMLEHLPEVNDYLSDPNSAVETQQPAYANGPSRAIRPEYLVFDMRCTHLGCIPTYMPEIGPTPFEENWHGGFFCPCHKSKFDLAGRVYKGVPAPTNLVIPPHHYADNEHVIVGSDPQEAA
ncbi:MAG: ubiquinol-cytochrome c reductase iron-sulfur subunit [Candidatus Wenzhouxiangella sp. M2_3B_020]